MGKNGNDKAPISLPKGGGAIKGIGETFQPNLFSGTGNFSVPIYTSPGRSGFGPQLTLQYSTGNGNGPFGLGWQLSIPRITRKTEKGLPTYTDQDVFVMSGAEDLMPHLRQVQVVSEGWDIVEQTMEPYSIRLFRPRTEGQFAESSGGHIKMETSTGGPPQRKTSPVFTDAHLRAVSQTPQIRCMSLNGCLRKPSTPKVTRFSTNIFKKTRTYPSPAFTSTIAAIHRPTFAASFTATPRTISIRISRSVRSGPPPTIPIT